MGGATKGWERFSGFLHKGDWHVHTNYVEGENSIHEMCEQARDNGLKLIAFTEHVRRKLDYDFNKYVKEIEHAKKNFPGLKILIGCEAKVLFDGGIDVSEEVAGRCDVVIASFHGFPPEEEEKIRALRTALRNPRMDIWGHPATFFRDTNPEAGQVRELIRLCIRNRVLIENSLCPKYRPPAVFLETARKIGAKTVISSDAHSVRELRKMS